MMDTQPHVSTEPNTALELRGITKSFEEKLALDNASLDVRWGEVHALLGENGAGKSTIMNVATGIYAADQGQTLIDGEIVAIQSPLDATRHGIGMVHQHFRLVPAFSVAQNILLACDGRHDDIRNVKDATRHVKAMGDRVGLGVDPAVRVIELSVAEQQQVEILKVLLLGARIVVLDEPTAVLTDQESGAVLSFIRELAAQGSAVVLITHKLREVTGFSDRVTVMRHGQVTLRGAESKGLSPDDLARHMVGEQIASVRPPSGELTAEILNIKGLSAPTRSGESGVGLDSLDLSVRGGEILGVAGVSGNGQHQLADVLMGLREPSKGSVHIGGHDVTAADMFERRNLGLRAIPSDRYGAGLVADLPVAENFALTGVRKGDYGRGLTFSRGRMIKAAAEAIERLNILGATPNYLTRLLSGGNAQKLLLARELNGTASVLMAHSPSRGLDVRACHAVHTMIRNAAEAGMACLLISEDLEEVLSLSSRIVVLSRGQITGQFASSEASPEKVGRAMLGHA